MENDKLFAVYLGGGAPKANIELHDVVFTVGRDIESLYVTLLGLWFGDPQICHIDSWIELQQVDGYDIHLSKEKPEAKKHLYFVNVGGYKDGIFKEFHENRFVVADSAQDAKKWALAHLMQGMKHVHKDDLYDVDDCIKLNKINDYYIHLKKAEKVVEIVPNNSYHKIPKIALETYLDAKKDD